MTTDVQERDPERGHEQWQQEDREPERLDWARTLIGNRISRIVDAISASKQASPMALQREYLTRAVELVQAAVPDWSGWSCRR